jgi:hypothetical protein
MRTTQRQDTLRFSSFLVILFACLGSSTGQLASTSAWYPSVLTNYTLPSWNPTNPIPFSPDKAVIAAMKHANQKQPGSWRATRISLQRFTRSDPWFYIVTLEGPSYMNVHVLLNGDIWRPGPNPW